MKEFNRANFNKFILDFDPIDYKFGKWDDIERKYIWKDIDTKADITNFNQVNLPVHIEPRDAAGMIISTEMAYGSLDKAMLYQEIFRKTLDKFLIEYVSIPGLSALFNEHYPEFEWSMHVNMNFKDQRNSYYRDHFIHQIRNMYMMFSLLNDTYIYKNAVDKLTNPSVCRLSEYVSDSMLKFRQIYSRTFDKRITEAFDSYKDDEKKCSFEDGGDCYFIRYVLYAASAIASLFHDIGYPISYFYEIEDRAVEFVPAFSALLNEGDVSFNHIKNILGDSLLFQIVNPKQIEKKFLKRDHGVLSALLLALNFYKNGKIHSLSIEKQVAIEFGILIIYNHTLDFLYCDAGCGSSLYKNQFARDPLSWLFRFCDDAQEWDREYFEIGSSPNLLFCPKCKTPLIKTTKNVKDSRDAFNQVSTYLRGDTPTTDTSLFDWPDFVKISNYTCRCKHQEGTHYDWERFRWFERRQIVTVNVCDFVEPREQFSTAEGSQKKLGYLRVNFHYDPYKQLRLCTIHHKFSEYRAKDLKKLKRFLQLQSFVVDNEGYKRVVLEHNLSPNPFLLKALIWGEYFKQSEKVEDKIATLEEKIAKIEKIVEEIYPGCYCTEFKNNVIFNSIFYMSLFYNWEDINKFKKGKDAVDAAVKVAEKWCFDKCSSFKPKNFAVCDYLTEWTAKQIENKYYFDDDGRVVFGDYEKYLIEDDIVYSLVEQYCDRDAPINQPDVYARDYYSDLYLYEWLSLKAKQEKIKNEAEQNKKNS